MRIKCILLDSPLPHTGRIYPKAVMEKAVADFRIKMLCGKTMGEITTNGYTPGLTINLNNVSHMVNDIGIDGDGVPYLWADIKILGSPAGKILEEFIDVPGLYFIPRGIGTVKDKVVEECELISIDAWMDDNNEDRK